MTLLKDKNFLIVGIASKLSIATGIAKSMARDGANLAFSYQNEKLQSRVEAVAQECGSSTNMCFPCDLAHDEQIDALFASIKKEWGHIDGLIHAVGYAPREQLSGDFTDATTRDGFAIAHDLSSYSFIALAKRAKPLIRDGGSLITLTYHGAQQTLPNYNVMGLAKASLEAATRYLAVSFGKQDVRVNAISAGPIKTLAASGISDFRKMLEYNKNRAPLARNVTIEEVGDTASFLSSDRASGITGQVIYVDGGFSITAMSGREMSEPADTTSDE